MTASLLGVYVAVQCLVPLRYLMYRTNPNWDEYGHYFSWHMLLRAKEKALAVYATDPNTGRSGMVDVRDFATIRQLNVVSRDPRLIHQLCHHLHDALEEMGYPDPEIRALSLVSLNGRKAQLMVDPSVDLAAEPLSWRYPEWIVPLQEPFRHDAWAVPRHRWLAELDLDLPPQIQLVDANKQAAR